jgi:hypothetical protein
MSVFTSRVTRTVAIPHDPEQTVTLRKLAPRHLEAAAKVAQHRSIEDFKAIGGAAFLKELQGMGGDKAATGAAKVDPLLQFDRLTLIQKGVTEWSYDAKLEPETFEDLDDETQEFLAREVLRLARPALFQTDEEQADARKNG